MSDPANERAAAGARDTAGHESAALCSMSEAAGLSADEIIAPRVADAWLALLVAYGRLTRALSNELMESERMSLADFDVLAQLARAPERRIRMSELADHVIISKSGLTRRIDRLSASGWVSRVRCATDGRVFWATLTPAGLKAFRAAAPGHLASVASRFGAAVPIADLPHLHAALNAIAARNRD
jgi:DNA-binding MarR family transcriptional regulator